MSLLQVCDDRVLCSRHQRGCVHSPRAPPIFWTSGEKIAETFRRDQDESWSQLELVLAVV